MTSVDAAALRADAAAHRPSVIDLGYVTMTIQLRFESIRSPDFGAAYIDAGSVRPLKLPEPSTYGGDVLENGALVPQSVVALVLDDENVHGFIRETDTSYNLQRADFPVADDRETVVYRNTDVAPWGIGASDVDRETGALNTTITTGIRPLVAGSGIVKIALFMDAEYAGHFGGPTAAANRMESDLFLVRGVLGHQFGYFLEESYLAGLSDGFLGTSNDIDTLIDAFQATASAVYPQVSDGQEWHLAHLFTYRDTTQSSGKTVYGTAHEGAISSEGAVALTQQKDEQAPIFAPESNDNHRKWPESHEIGHVLGGDHCRAVYGGNPFLGSGTKTIMAAWGTQDECSDTPAVPYAYNYQDLYSNSVGAKNNVLAMNTLIASRIGGSPTPSAPTGPSGSAANSQVVFTAAAAAPVSGQPCSTSSWYKSYVQIDWGDGMVSTKPGRGEGYCNSKQLSHTYDTPGTYSVSVRVKFGYWHEWSAWSSPATITITTPPPPPPGDAPAVAPPNNGVGSGWDSNANRVGQMFSVSPGTITKICGYMQANSGSVTYRTTSGGSGSDPTIYNFQGTLTAGTSDGWACQSVSQTWTSATLLIYYETGAGHMGYRDVPDGTGGSYVAFSSGGNWQPLTGYDRGFGFTMTGTGGGTPAVAPPQNGVGTGWDSDLNRAGQMFTGISSGTITKICSYLQANSGSITYRVTSSGAGSDSSIYNFGGTLTAPSSDGWACDNVNQAWSNPTMLIYYDGGSGKPGYHSVASGGGSYYASFNGGTWQAQSGYDRGFGYTMTTAPPPPTAPSVVPARAYTGHWDLSHDRIGQLYTSVTSGTISAICLDLQASSGSVTYRVSDGGDGSSTTSYRFSGTLTAKSTDGWVCDSVNQPWTSSNLLIYAEKGGSAGISYAGPSGNTGWSMYGPDDTSTWARQSDYDRGFGYTMSGAPPPPTTPSVVPARAYTGKWDTSHDRVGQLYTSVTSGTISAICLDLQANSGSATYRVTDGGEGSSTASYRFSGTLTAKTTDGWVCDGVSQPWTSANMLIYIEKGSSALTSYAGPSGSTGWSMWGPDSTSTSTWSRQGDFDRGFGYTMS